MDGFVKHEVVNKQSTSDIFRPFKGGVAISSQTSIATPFRNTIFNFVGQKKDPASILTKYVPKESSKLFQNKKNIATLKKWILDKLSGVNTHPFVLLVGTTGVGKTELIKLCFQECNCSVIEYDEEIRSNFFELLMKNVSMTNIENMINNNTTHFGIVIDNYQTTLSSNNRKELIDLLKTKGTCPVVFTSSSYNNITDLIRLKGLVLYFENPSDSDLVSLAKTVMEDRSIYIDEKKIEELVNSCSCDIRSFLNTIDLVSQGCEDTVKSELSITKDVELDVDDTFFYLFQSDVSFKDKIRLTSLYTSNITQENYLEIGSKIDSSVEDMFHAAEYCSMGDQLKQFMFETQSWDELNDITNTISTMGPIHFLTIKDTVPIKIKIPNRKVNTLPENFIYCGYNLEDLSYIMYNIYAKPNEMDRTSSRFETEGYPFDNLFNFVRLNEMDFDIVLKIITNVYQLHNMSGKDIKRIVGKIKKQYKAVSECANH